LKYLVEPAPLGTGGAYKFAEAFLDTSTIVLNGDILTDVDLERVAEQHRESGAAATIDLTRVENRRLMAWSKPARAAKLCGFWKNRKLRN
jgi:NDP-sugar pyrophosphorylase family protein